MFYKPTNLQTYKPTNLQTYKPTNLQTYKPTNLQTYKPTNLQTYKPTNLQTYKPTNLQTYKPTNLQTYKPCLKRTNFFTQLVAVLLIVSISGAGCNKTTDAKSSEATITAFSFATPVATGTISAGGNISITVPAGTPVTALIATFALSNGATAKVGDVLQVSGNTANDFTHPVKYTVTSQDGTTTHDYQVSVNIQTANSKAITSFSFETLTPAVIGTISGTNINITLPIGTDATSLVATFSTTGASVKVGTTPQISGTTPNDFTNPVTYTVTAQDGTTTQYTVTVMAPQLSDKKITAFYFNGLGFGAIGEINEPNHTIAVDVKTGTDITALKATFVITGASVKVGTTTQVSGTTPNSFESLVTYTVTAKDGSTQDYIVKVTPTDTKYVTIPDANFVNNLKYVINNGNNAGIFGTGDNANKLNVYDSRVISTTRLTSQSSNIVDFTGIEYFVNMTNFDCRSNGLTTLDVSKNTALTTLNCWDNQLSTLDVSSQTSWTALTIYSDPVGAGENLLTTLKVNVAQKDNPEVKKVKTNNPLCIISTYTNNSTEAAVSSDYTPQ